MLYEGGETNEKIIYIRVRDRRASGQSLRPDLRRDFGRYFEKDPYGRVAAETTTTTGYAMVMGEISTKCYVDIPKLVRRVILDIGYDRSALRV